MAPRMVDLMVGLKVAQAVLHSVQARAVMKVEKRVLFEVSSTVGGMGKKKGFW